MASFSYIVPYYHSYHNVKILKKLSSEILKAGAHLIIVECGKHPNINLLDFPGKYKFVESDVYNLGWLYNIGQFLATTDKLIFGDLKYYPSFNLLKSISDNDSHECLYIQSKLIPLNREETLSNKRDPGKNNMSQTISEGVIFYTKEAFNKIGGFDENIFGINMYKFQEQKGKTFLTTGQVNEGVTYQLDVDSMSIDEKIMEKSNSHYEKIKGLEDQQLLNYQKVQHKRRGYRHKYHKYDLMSTDV